MSAPNNTSHGKVIHKTTARLHGRIHETPPQYPASSLDDHRASANYLRRLGSRRRQVQGATDLALAALSWRFAQTGHTLRKVQFQVRQFAERGHGNLPVEAT
jgi:hypothetical protein